MSTGLARGWSARRGPGLSLIIAAFGRVIEGLIGAQSINEVGPGEYAPREAPEEGLTRDRHVTKSWVTLKNGPVPAKDGPAVLHLSLSNLG